MSSAVDHLGKTGGGTCGEGKGLFFNGALPDQFELGCLEVGSKKKSNGPEPIAKLQ